MLQALTARSQASFISGNVSAKGTAIGRQPEVVDLTPFCRTFSRAICSQAAEMDPSGNRRAPRIYSSRSAFAYRSSLYLPSARRVPTRIISLSIIGILSCVQPFVGMSLVRAAVPVLHFIQVRRCALVGHTKCISDRRTQQASLEFLEHRSYIEKSG